MCELRKGCRYRPFKSKENNMSLLRLQNFRKEETYCCKKGFGKVKIMQADEILNMAQTYQQQIQVVMTQKAALTLELNEIKKAIEELERTKQGDVFKISGPILIRVDAKDLKKELDDKKELINLRIKTLEKQENKLKEKIEELRNKLLNVRKNSR